jgi:hypothetical protein
MKVFEIPMVVTSLVGLCLLGGLDTAPAHANFTFGQPTNLGPAIDAPGEHYSGTISPDGLEFYLASGTTIWVLRRTTVDSAWAPPSVLGPLVGSPYTEGVPFLSADGLSLYFSSPRPGGSGSQDLWVTTRTATGNNWGPPMNLGATVNSASWDWGGSLSADGLELYFTSNRPGGYGSHDLYVARRTTQNAAWGTPVNLGPTVNSSAWDESPAISPDGLTLFFCSARPGGYGSWDLYMTRRATTEGPWDPPLNLGPLVNSTGDENNVTISPDGATLYFSSTQPRESGGGDLWQAPIIAIVDFNGDGQVDAADMALLVANWGKNNSLCDIGPYPWGDGVVDEKDLGILMESLMTPGPKASDVPCDVVLSWVSASSTPTQDVYLGTSFEAVNAASRANPQGMLVSQGQPATTYDPPGLLELSRTYYWRVDFVIAGPPSVIIKGPVLKFTTAALTYSIKNITATASSAQAGSGPERTVDGSGLDKTDGHSTGQKDMWWSMAEPSHWIQYEFDKVYTLHELWVWNFNMMMEPYTGFGAKTVKIEYSTDGTAWTPLANVPEFARGTGKPGYTANTIVSFAGVPAKFVKLTIEKNWGVAPQTGLSEVRFFCIQSAAVAKP